MVGKTIDERATEWIQQKKPHQHCTLSNCHTEIHALRVFIRRLGSGTIRVALDHSCRIYGAVLRLSHVALHFPSAVMSTLCIAVQITPRKSFGKVLHYQPCFGCAVCVCVCGCRTYTVTATTHSLAHVISVRADRSVDCTM